MWNKSVQDYILYHSVCPKLQRFCITQARKVARQLFSQEGCSPYKVAILPWVQLPLWITLSFALRDMTGIFPNKTPLNPEVAVSLASEGLLWFSNLTLPDPYCVLPVMLALTNFLNIEVCDSLLYLFN